MADGELRTLRGKMEVRKLMREAEAAHQPQVELAFLLQDWDDPYNVGGMFRVADACGAVRMVLTGKTPAPPHPQIHVTSMGNHRRVAWEQQERHDEAISQLKAEAWTLVAVEIAEGAVPYTQYDFPARTCLVLGNEEKGMYDRVLRQCDAAVYIPMGGKGRSLNVHVSGAVVAFHALYGPRLT